MIVGKVKERDEMKTKRTRIAIIMAIIALLSAMILSSCASMAPEEAIDIPMDYDAAERGYVLTEEYDMGQEYAPEAAPYDTINDKRGGAVVTESKLRHIIRTGSINLTVKDTRETIRDIRQMVDEAGGIIGSSYVYEVREGQYAANMTLRVPEARFEAIMEQLETLGKATNAETGIEDVTMQYVDLESRLNNQIAQEERLAEILEMADTVEEVLEIERELYRVRGEIESMTATLNHLKDRVSFSTIHLTLREETIPTESISPGPFDEIGSRITQAFIGSINFLLRTFSFALIAFAALLPVIIIMTLLIAAIWLLARKLSRRKGKAVQKEQ